MGVISNRGAQRSQYATLYGINQRRNPALTNLYNHLGDDQVVAYVDETYYSDELARNGRPGTPVGFYTMSAAIYRGRDIANVRDDLSEITNSSYWHSTDAVQTPEGLEAFLRLLDYFHENSDVSLLVTQIPLEDSKEGVRLEARSNCLRNLVSQLADGVTGLRAVVLEKNNKAAIDNRDRRDFKALQGSRRIPTHVQNLHVSPSEEKLLWAPDTVAFAYRRGLTHTDDSSQWFNRIKVHSHVTVLDSTKGVDDIPPISESARAFLAAQDLS